MADDSILNCSLNGPVNLHNESRLFNQKSIYFAIEKDLLSDSLRMYSANEGRVIFTDSC